MIEWGERVGNPISSSVFGSGSCGKLGCATLLLHACFGSHMDYCAFLFLLDTCSLLHVILLLYIIELCLNPYHVIGCWLLLSRCCQRGQVKSTYQIDLRILHSSFPPHSFFNENEKPELACIVLLTKLKHEWIHLLCCCRWPKNSRFSSNMVRTNTLMKVMHILGCKGFW